MKREDVPAEMVEKGRNALGAHLRSLPPAGAYLPTLKERTRAILAAVLPVHERMVREQVAKEIETFACRGGEQCQDRFCPDCIRHDQAQRDAQIARGGA